MKKRMLIIFLSTTFMVYAKSPKKVPVYSFGKTQVFFKEFQKGTWIDLGCKDKKCKAYKASLKSYRKPKNLSGGKNPAAAICKHVLKAKVVIGFTTKGEQQSFCRFSDNSLLLLNSSLY